MISDYPIGECLKDVTIDIPVAVTPGDTVKMRCLYNLENESLYTVKWYKGRQEFYRYVPKELPHTRVFPLPGVNVDVSIHSSPLQASLVFGMLSITLRKVVHAACTSSFLLRTLLMKCLALSRYVGLMGFVRRLRNGLMRHDSVEIAQEWYSKSRWEVFYVDRSHRVRLR